MEFEHDEQHANHEEKQSPYERGIIVFFALAVFTFIEYVIGTTEGKILVFSSNLVPLGVIALLKAGLIVNYFMHISRLWSSGEDLH